MRILAGVDRDYEGRLRFGSGVEASYFAQDTAERMARDRTVEEEAESLCPTDLLPKIRNLLGAFLFRGDDIEKSVRVLSGGERSRLALLKMLLHPANLLILDEPTNHLDLTSKDVLLEALKSFAGTVLFVSHDRLFIEELADRVLELEDGASPRWYVGDYRYYLEKKASLEAAGDDGELRALGAPASAGGGRAKPGRPPSYGEDKARKARSRKLQKREEEILARIEAIGAQKAAAEREMGLPGQLFRRRQNEAPRRRDRGARPRGGGAQRGMGARGSRARMRLSPIGPT